MDPNDVVKANRAIRLNVIGALVMFAFVVLSLLLIAAGMVRWEPTRAIWLAFGAVTGSLLLLMARSMREDLDDPAGIQRRYESGATVLGAAMIVVGLVAVVGLIAWGLVSSPG